MTYRVALIPGDGIGQEVIPAATEVLKATGLDWEFIHLDAGWDCFQRTGHALPDETLAQMQACVATLFGAVQSPAYKVAGYRSPILGMRQALDLYANLRPVRSVPIAASRPNIDMLIVRENTEDLYVRRERIEENGERAVAERVITRRASLRIARVAFEQARKRAAQRIAAEIATDVQVQHHLSVVTMVHKANILPETDGLFKRCVQEVAREYPDVGLQEQLVDSMAMRLIRDPENFDVVVTTNLFGDILSDEAAMLVGGLGLAASGNIGTHTAVFEPVHGSAPDIAGQGIANPLAAINAAAMMLEYLGESGPAKRLAAAVERVLQDGPLPADLGGAAGTLEVTQAVMTALKRNA